MQTNKQIYSWAMYDWANSAYATTVMAGFFPLFFKSYFSTETDVITSTAHLGIANSISSMIIVLLAPFLGAIADVGGLKKHFLFLFTYLGILMSGSLALIEQGDWQLAAFIYVLGNIGFMGSNIFNDSQLTNSRKREESGLCLRTRGYPGVPGRRHTLCTQCLYGAKTGVFRLGKHE